MPKSKLTICLLGNTGNLGRCFFEYFLSKDKVKLIVINRAEINTLNYKQLELRLKEAKPDYIINNLAFTNIDIAENQPLISFRANVQIVKNLVRISSSLTAKFIFFSTDYVFDGQKNIPYCEDDPVNPLMVYGRHKLLAENYILKNGHNFLIFRISWLFYLKGHNLMTRLLEQAKLKKEIKVSYDNYGSPSSVKMITEILGNLIVDGVLYEVPNNLFHLANSGIASRYDLLHEALRLGGYSLACLPTSFKNFKSDIKRPIFSVLDKSRFENYFNLNLPHWRESLELEFKRASH